MQPVANDFSAPTQRVLLTKPEINLLPIKKYEGPVEVVRDDKRLREVAAELRHEKLLGFDIEIRPSFRSGDSFPPALVQLAGEKNVILVQIKKIGDLNPLAELFGDPLVIKAGVAIAGDITKLHEVVGFEPAGFVELGRMAEKRGIKASGVRTLAANLLRFRISKGAQCSNWERSDLAPTQIAYAATDAWVCREIYIHLEKLPISSKNALKEHKKRPDDDKKTDHFAFRSRIEP